LPIRLSEVFKSKRFRFIILFVILLLKAYLLQKV
jgi:hypothetical protein